MNPKTILDMGYEYGSGAAFAAYGALVGNVPVVIVGLALVGVKMLSNLTDADKKLC